MLCRNIAAKGFGKMLALEVIRQAKEIGYE
jgi:hypothetical protein